MRASLATIFLLLAAASRAAEEEPTPTVARAQAASATVWMAHDDSAVDRFTENPAVSRRMVDAVVLAATGENEIGRAWRKLVAPGDRVGVKVNAGPGRNFSTRIGVVRAILAGLERAGVSPSSVLVWDREGEDLKNAGFTSRTLGCAVRGIDPPKGWDRAATFSAPAIGRLIWGDAIFVEKNTRALGKPTTDSDQVSSTSHFATIVTRDLTKIINVATLTDDAGAGLGSVFYNLCVKNVDNWRRFAAVEQGAADSIPELYASAHLGPKVALHILDGLIAQYAGGPDANPNYAFTHATLYASRDPVALDALAARKIDEWRKLAKLPPIARHVEWLRLAEQMGLGESSESRLKLVSVTP
ncbi:MAG: DUF362 domain-containing protein [Chthoniobacteraceae bacterium]